jgi:hypothetical protein
MFIIIVLEERYAWVAEARVEQLDDLQRKGNYIVPPKVVRIVSANNLGCSVNNLQTVIPF